MSTTSRAGKKWSINEILTLQREFELLSLPIDQIAQNHKRSITAIISKLDIEGFITSSESSELNRKHIPSKQTDSFLIKEEDLMNRMWNLETNVSHIGSLVKELGKVNSTNAKSPKKSLRL